MHKITLFFILLFSFATTSCELLIRVGTTYEWPPYIYKVGNKVAGIEVEILDAVLSKTPFCREFIEMPSSSRALEELKQKRVDMLVAASVHPDRELFAKFSHTYRDEKMVVFAQKKFSVLTPVLGDDEYLQRLNQTDNIIAVNLGSIYGKKFEQFLTEYKGGIVHTILARRRFDMLKRNRIDYAIEDELSGLSLLKDKYYSEHIENTNMVVNYNSIHYMLRPDLMSSSQLQQFNQAIEDSHLIIQNIIKKYTINS